MGVNLTKESPLRKQRDKPGAPLSLETRVAVEAAVASVGPHLLAFISSTQLPGAGRGGSISS